jgi:prepilin-type N-terminal cleavage/methylation domain-containing protein
VKTTAEPGRGREGFTLVEVLVAMVILAVGLLALESLAIGGARMVARADRQTELTALGSAQVEQVLQRIEMGVNPGNADVTAAGTRTQTVVTRQAAGTRHWVYTVQVTVTPPPHQKFTLNPITVVGRAIQAIP